MSYMERSEILNDLAAAFRWLAIPSCMLSLAVHLKAAAKSFNISDLSI